MRNEASAPAGKITRKLDKIERGGREAWRLTAERIYTTDVEDVWDALTNPQRIPRWFLPISGDLKLGGRFQFEGNAGGIIERCDARRHLGVTWEMHGDTSWVDVTLTPQGKDTLLTLQHVAHVPEELFDQFGPGGVGIGWDLALVGLSKHFETGAAVDPKEAEKWVLSPEGRAFVEACSGAWAQASIEAGTERDKAEKAAGQVSDFYSPRTS